MDKNLVNFITESNRIEGITDFSIDQQYKEYCDFLDSPSPTKKSILHLAMVLHVTSLDSHRVEPEIRNKEGMDVRVGDHRPMPGGLRVELELENITHLIGNEDINEQFIFRIHQQYEKLHPLTDGNGRTGRAIWAYMMYNELDYRFQLGFLHKWYYQSLSNWRV